MSGTSRAWFKICAPELYRRILFRSPRTVRELIEDLSKPGSHIAQHARALVIFGPVPWQDLLKSVRVLPSLDQLYIGFSDESTDSYNPNLFRLTCRILAASRVVPALTMLKLECHTFHSAADVLRLCASLPRLLLAEFSHCSIASTPELVPHASATNVTQLRLAVYLCDVVQAASLAQWWQWSHPATSSTNDLFPGLHVRDSLAVCGILKSACTSDP